MTFPIFSIKIVLVLQSRIQEGGKKLTEEKLLKRDREYLEKAANVQPWEREIIETGLEKGLRLLPNYLSPDQEIFCPVWRLRLKVLQQVYRHAYIDPKDTAWQANLSPEDVIRQIIWRLDYNVKRAWWIESSGERAFIVYPIPDGGDYPLILVEISVLW